MGGLRRLRRKGANKYSVKPLRPAFGFEANKLSAVIMDFARPLTESVEDDQFETAITLAILCWNVALLPEDEQERKLGVLKTKLAEDKPAWWIRDLEGWTRRLVDRKKRLFGHDRRMVVNYTITDEGDDFHLYVVSTPVPDSLTVNPE